MTLPFSLLFIGDHEKEHHSLPEHTFISPKEQVSLCPKDPKYAEQPTESAKLWWDGPLSTGSGRFQR